MVLKKIVTYIFILAMTAGCTNKKQESIPKNWSGFMKITSHAYLPLIFELNFNAQDTSFTLINGQEKLVYPLYKKAHGNYLVRLEPYNSELAFSLSKTKITGVWTNIAKGPEYKIDFEAWPEKQISNSSKSQKNTFLMQFGTGDSEYSGILVLSNKNSQLTGTIKTETGDYRYLWGEQENDSMWLSCFDGAHAFLFTAKANGDKLENGVFYSGNHYIDFWSASKNGNAKLSDPTQLTKFTSDSVFRYTLINQNKKIVSHQDEEFKGKVNCIQIMGTWCPNCKDETEYLKELRSQYDTSQLKIIAAAFEYEQDTSMALNRIEQYSSSMKMNYPIYYGGSTNKKKVTDVFPDLDRVISYPTLIILDKKGNVVQVHTGFNGPATDEYSNFVQHTNKLIDSLIFD